MREFYGEFLAPTQKAAGSTFLLLFSAGSLASAIAEAVTQVEVPPHANLYGQPVDRGVAGNQG